MRRQVRSTHRAQDDGKPPEWSLIETPEQLQELCGTIQSEGRFAFDTEFVMEDRYEPEVCLLQIATDSRVSLIDPFLDFDLQPIWELVADEKIETVVHAGQEDLALCVQHIGKVPRNVFDVQIAAGFVGYDYPLSLQKLIQLSLRVRVHKTKTLTDWRRRPLTAAQLRYAAEDVAFLLPIRAHVDRLLAEHKRTDWAHEEFRRFEDLSLYGRVEEEKVRRLKGTANMDGQQLAVVTALLNWREGLAEQLNRPVRTVLKDHLLVEIARLGLSTHEEIRDLRGINLSEKNVRLMGNVVKEALALPPEHWPEPLPRVNEIPGEDVLIALLTAVIRSHCLKNDIAYGLASTKGMISELVRSRITRPAADAKPPELLTGWRAQAIGAVADSVLSGTSAVRVSTKTRTPQLDIEPRRS
jgi:ribonuclease D